MKTCKKPHTADDEEGKPATKPHTADDEEGKPAKKPHMDDEGEREGRRSLIPKGFPRGHSAMTEFRYNGKSNTAIFETIFLAQINEFSICD